MRELFSDFREVSVAVLVSSVVAAGIEALVAFLGYFVTHTPQTLIFTVVTFVAAFIPVEGWSSSRCWAGSRCSAPPACWRDP
jgi:predicted PurR-regulated permease PerM